VLVYLINYLSVTVNLIFCRFLQFGKGQAWNISRIEGTFVESMKLLKPDVACLSHTALTRLIELGTETIDEVEWSTVFLETRRKNWKL
jgi:hypothetical protein